MTIPEMRPIKSIVVEYGKGYSETIIKFAGFDYRDGLAWCALRDYVTGYENPKTGEYLVINCHDQWSRRATVSLFSSQRDYSEQADAYEIARSKLMGRC